MKGSSASLSRRLSNGVKRREAASAVWQTVVTNRHVYAERCLLFHFYLTCDGGIQPMCLKASEWFSELFEQSLRVESDVDWSIEAGQIV